MNNEVTRLREQMEQIEAKAQRVAAESGYAAANMLWKDHSAARTRYIIAAQYAGLWDPINACERTA